MLPALGASCCAGALGGPFSISSIKTSMSAQRPMLLFSIVMDRADCSELRLADTSMTITSCANCTTSANEKAMRKETHMAEKKKLSARQLVRLTEKIERWTDGKQRIVSDFSGGVCIEASRKAIAGLNIWKNIDLETGLCKLEFLGFIREMGTYMPAAKMREVAREIGQLAGLLEELEREPIIVTEEEMARWVIEITAKQVDQAIAQSKSDSRFDPEPAPDPAMEPR